MKLRESERDSDSDSRQMHGNLDCHDEKPYLRFECTYSENAVAASGGPILRQRQPRSEGKHVQQANKHETKI